MSLRCLPTLLALALATILSGTPTERGLNPTEVFTPKDYLGHYQVWEVVQGPEGRIFAGSYESVHVFDGSAWTKATARAAFVRELAVDAAGRVWAGGDKDLGYLDPLPEGGFTFVSVLDRLPAQAEPFGFVRDLVPFGDAMFAADDTTLLRFDPEGEVAVKSFEPAARTHLFARDGHLFATRSGEGLYAFKDGTWKLQSTSEWWQRDGRFSITDGPSGFWATLVFYNGELLALRDPDTVEAYPHAATAELSGGLFYRASHLRDGTLALASTGTGLYLLDPDGVGLRHLTKASGLGDDVVISLMEDRENSLWLGTNNGLTRVDRTVGVTSFDEHNGLPSGIVFHIHRSEDGTFYMAYANRLYRLVQGDALEGTPARFEIDPRMQNYEGSIRFVTTFQESLLLATSAGLLRVTSDGYEELIKPSEQDSIFRIHPSVSDPTRLFLHWTSHVSTARWDGERWIDEGILPGARGEYFSGAEDALGNYWVGDYTGHLIRFSRPDTEVPWQSAEARTYDRTDGLPEGAIMVQTIARAIAIGTTEGLMRWAPESDQLQPDRRFRLGDDDRPAISDLQQDSAGDFWCPVMQDDGITARIGLARFKKQDDGTWRGAHFAPLVEQLLGLSGSQLVYLEMIDGKEVLWAKGLDRMLRLELDQDVRPTPLPVPVLQRFTAAGRAFPLHPEKASLRLPFSREPIRFDLAVPTFAGGEQPLLQYRLIGFRQSWSPSASDETAVYTNLIGGPFTFEARAVGSDGTVGKSVQLSFYVVPPWYRSTAAILAYIILGALMVAIYVRWRLAAGERALHRLEAIVVERTSELREAKEVADSASRAKSAFLANMSHELRTPLNGILGYTQVLQRDAHLEPRQRDQLGIIGSSGRHLLRLVNEVLDLSKIEAGRMEFHEAPFNLRELLREVLSNHSIQASRKELALVTDFSPELPSMVVGDAQKLRQVMENLLSNAIKFTTAGTVTWSTRITPESSLQVEVRDTGPGIPLTARERIFEAFQQTETTSSEASTGLGLPIARRLAEIMGGSLRLVEGGPDGSLFSLAIPVELLALEPEEASSSRHIVGYEGPRRRILAVDDVPINRQLLADLLTPLGFVVDLAAEGEEALAMAGQTPYDAILLDLRMKGLDGLATAKALRQQTTPGTPRPVIIAMSASVIAFDPGIALRAGCDDFLGKPFVESDLLERLGSRLHLQWIEEAATESVISDEEITVTAESLADLRQAASSGDIEAIQRWLSTQCHGGAWHHQLKQLAHSYRMAEIREHLESAPLRQDQP